MTRERLTLYDTTLRDGQQTQGVLFSVADKRRIAAMLDDLGIGYIEGGWPGANPIDSEFFADAPTTRASRIRQGRFTATPFAAGAGRGTVRFSRHPR